MCNSSRFVAIDCHLLPVHSPNTAHSSTHAKQVSSKDVDVMRRLYNCWFGRVRLINCVSSIRILWFSVPFYISVVRLYVLCAGDRLRGRRIEFHQEYSRQLGVQHTNTTDVLLPPVSITIACYQVCHSFPNSHSLLWNIHYYEYININWHFVLWF